MAKSIKSELARIVEPRREEAVGVSCSLPRSMDQRLEEFAREKRTTKSEVVRRALADYITYDLSESTMIARRPRATGLTMAQKRKLEKERYREDRALLLVARSLVQSETELGEEVRNRLSKLAA